MEVLEGRFVLSMGLFNETKGPGYEFREWDRERLLMRFSIVGRNGCPVLPRFP